MAAILPFDALRPRADLASKVASVPYDVVGTEEARALARGNEQSFLHVTKPEIDLAEGTDPYGDAVYAKGAESLRQFIDSGILVRDAKPCLYAYALTREGRRQTGIVMCASVADYDANIVRKHEHTRPSKENDRVRHMEALGAQSGTVFLAHRDSPTLSTQLQGVTAAAPEVDFVADDGVRHQLWVIEDEAQIAKLVQAFADLGPIYVADGHHRSAAASRVAAARREPGAVADAPHEGFLAVSFPTSEITILPYNRIVKDLGGRSAREFLDAVAERFEVTAGKPEPIRPKSFGLFLKGAWHQLTTRTGSYDEADAVGRLDVAILQDQLLSPLLGIDDPRRDDRIDFVGGIRGDAELERRVGEGWAAAFSLYPTSIEDLLAIADAGLVMPPKSTWFEPKLRDGLFVHMI